ncbi:MAG TPA: M28 family peptidase [Propionibacteriaceae bacterium]|nr:M28 family peptidase [Propionibacteriaceae bacterium]
MSESESLAEADSAIRQHSSVRPEASQDHVPPLARLALVVMAFASVGVALLPLYVKPGVAPGSVPASDFSAERAMSSVQAIAGAPHPIASAEHDAAVDYLLGQLRQLGLAPELQEDTGVRYDTDLDPSQVSAAHLQNIVARLPGTNSTGTVMLYGHYGSVPTSNNAADGAAGVAAVLETVRAIRNGPGLRNDVLVVLADGDETPALGPIMFRTHPAAKDITVGIALEALAPTGATALAYAGQGTPDAPTSFTSPDNGSWLRQALQVMPHRFTTLALNDLQLASPELSIATKDAAAGGIGFLFLGGGAPYHTLRDAPAHLDPARLQAYGDNTLALARHFGNAALDRQDPSPEVVAFTVLPDIVLSYRAVWGSILALLLVGLFAVVAIAGFRRKRLRAWGVVVGFAISVVSVPIAMVVNVAAWLLVVAINPAYRAPMARGYYGASWNLLFLTCLTLATVSTLYVLARRFLPPARSDLSVATGAVLLPLLVAVLTAQVMPAAAYVFTWPTLVAILVLGWTVLRPGMAYRPWLHLAGLAAVLITTSVAALSLVYIVYSVFAAPGSARQSPLYPVLGLVVVAVLAGVLVPCLHFLASRRRWIVPVALLALAAVFLGAQLVASRFNAERPRPNFIQYSLNADTGQATWLSAGNRPDAWTRQFFPGDYRRETSAFSPGYYFEQQLEIITAPAPTVPLAEPKLAVLEKRQQGDELSLRLRLSSSRGAPYAHLDLQLPGELLAAAVNGVSVNTTQIPPNRRQRFTLLYFGLPARGAEISMTLRGTGTITGRLVDYSNDLPRIRGLTVQPRPPDFIPAPYDFRDPTAVSRSVQL